MVKGGVPLCNQCLFNAQAAQGAKQRAQNTICKNPSCPKPSLTRREAHGYCKDCVAKSMAGSHLLCPDCMKDLRRPEKRYLGRCAPCCKDFQKRTQSSSKACKACAANFVGLPGEPVCRPCSAKRLCTVCYKTPCRKGKNMDKRCQACASKESRTATTANATGTHDASKCNHCGAAISKKSNELLCKTCMQRSISSKDDAKRVGALGEGQGC